MSASNVSRTRSPTSSISAPRSSCEASACPTLLTVASSATRWRVSCTRCAFWSAAPTLPASVTSNRWSESLNACSRIDVLQRDDARGTAAGVERHEEHRLRRLSGDRRRVAVVLGRRRDIVVHEQGLTGLEHVLPETDERHRLDDEALPPLDHEGEAEKSRRLVVGRDADCLRVVHLLDLVADHLVDRLRVELGGDRGLHAVDQGELCVPPPRLVDQPGVLQRHAETGGERRQESLIRAAEGMRAVQVLERDHTGCDPTDHERYEQRRARRFAAEDEGIAVALGLELRSAVVDHQRLTRVHHVLAEADQRDRLVRETRAPLDGVREADQPRRGLVDADVDDLRVEDLLILSPTRS